jgi:hypothetical protein
VIGGRGDAGASVLAPAIGLDAGALLPDCDPLGGGVDLLLGADSATVLAALDCVWMAAGSRCRHWMRRCPSTSTAAGLLFFSGDRAAGGPP